MMWHPSPRSDELLGSYHSGEQLKTPTLDVAYSLMGRLDTLPKTHQKVEVWKMFFLFWFHVIFLCQRSKLYQKSETSSEFAYCFLYLHIYTHCVFMTGVRLRMQLNLDGQI